MPFSPSIKLQFEGLADDAIKRVKFDTSEDISFFCQAALSKLSNQNTPETAPSKYDEDISDLQNLIDEGFDQVNWARPSLSNGYADSPTFTPNSNDNDRISEARSEFKTIITQRLQAKLRELSSMNEAQRKQYIENQQSKRQEAEVFPMIIGTESWEKKPPRTTPAAPRELKLRETAALTELECKQLATMLCIVAAYHCFAMEFVMEFAMDLALVTRQFPHLNRERRENSSNANQAEVKSHTQPRRTLETLFHLNERYDRYYHAHNNFNFFAPPPGPVLFSRGTELLHRAHNNFTYFDHPNLPDNPTRVSNNPSQPRELNHWEECAIERYGAQGLTEVMLRSANNNQEQFTVHHYEAFSCLVGRDEPIDKALQSVAKLSPAEARALFNQMQNSRRPGSSYR